MKITLFPRTRCLLSLLLTLLICGCAADRAFRQGNELFAAGQYEEGVNHLQQAMQMAPDNVEYRASWLRRRDEAVATLFSQAETARNQGRFEDAEKLCQRIGTLYPNHPRLVVELQRLNTQRAFVSMQDKIRELVKQGDKPRAAALIELALRDNPNHPELLSLRRGLEGDSPSRASPASLNALSRKPVTLEFRNANLKMVFEALARNTGINFILDRDVRADLSTTIFVKKVPLEDAVDLILSTNKLGKKILNASTVLVYPATQEKQAEYQDQVIKNFYLTNGDAKRTAEMLKSLLKIKNIHIDEKLNMVAIRDSLDTVALAGKLIANQDLGEPEVMLEVEVLEVKRTRLTQLGVQFPSQLTFTPLQTATGSNLLINDLFNLSKNNVTVSGATASINLQRDTGDSNILANPRIRARNKEKANILIGNKLPILSTTTTSTGVISENIQYLDVGLKLEVEPTIYLDNEVGIKVAMEVSSLGTQITSKSGTIAYQIGTRNASTLLRLKDGETQVLAGLINDEERNSASKLPGLGDIPGLGRLFSSQKDDNSKTEIVLSITPHIIRSLRTPLPQDAEVWIGTENYPRLKPLSLETGSGDATAAATAQPPSAQSTPAATQLAPEGTQSTDAESDDFATSNGPVKAQLGFEVQKSALKVGEATTVSLKLKADGGVRSLPLQIGFDSKLFDVSGVTEGGFFKKGEGSGIFSSTTSQAEGKIFVSAASTNIRGAKGQDSVLSFTLIAKVNGQGEIKILSANPISANNLPPQLSTGAPLQITVQ